MGWFSGILDAGIRSLQRSSLRVFGRDRQASEDKLLDQPDRDEVLNRCHDLRRNNAVVAGAVRRIEDNVVGSHFRVQVRTSDPAWNNAAEKWLKTWSHRVDAGRRLSLTSLARQIVSARLIDGEVLLVPQPDGQVTPVEAERLRAKDGEHEAFNLDDRTGIVKSWHVAARDKRTGEVSSTEGYDVRDAIHAAYRWRIDQVRGWPELATVANICADVGEINDANLAKYKIGAKAAWMLTGGGRLPGRGETPTGEADKLATAVNGMIIKMRDGQKLESVVNNQPGGEYGPFIEINLRLVGMATGLPYEFLLCYFGGSNFASSRAALSQAHKTIETYQDWLWEEAIYPLLCWRIARAVAEHELPEAPVDEDGLSEMFKLEWQRPALDWLDPQSAVQAEMQQVRMGATSMPRVCAAHGVDAEEILRESADYLLLVKKVAAEKGIPPDALHNITISGQPPISLADVAKVQEAVA